MSSSSIENLNNIITYAYKYVVPLLYLFGNIGNLLSILIFLKKAWRKNVCVLYFIIYIFFNLCFINCTVLGSILSSGYNIGIQNSNVFLCKMYIYFSFLFATVSPSILILASIDRLLISSENVNTRLYSSKRLAYFAISISTCFWMIFNIHLLIKSNIEEFGPSDFVCYYDQTKWYLDFVFYSLLIIHILLGVVMIILSILSFKNVHHIRTIPRQQRKQLRSMNKKDFQLHHCLFVQGIVFIIFSLLINFFYVYQAATRDQTQTLLQQTIGNFFNNIFSILYDIPYCTNFIVFMITSKAFRHEIKRSVYKMCGKGLIAPQEEENKQENIEINIAVVNSIVLSN